MRNICLLMGRYLSRPFLYAHIIIQCLTMNTNFMNTGEEETPTTEQTDAVVEESTEEVETEGTPEAEVSADEATPAAPAAE